jgi:NAD(P)-dependent dehydrogenase (short-subunit alcohol dehydrogenase family)
MRLELAPAGINVSHVIPGLFETEGITADRLPIDGEMAPRDVTVFAPGTGPGPVSTVVDTITLVIGLPEGVGVDEIVVRPTGHLRP